MPNKKKFILILLLCIVLISAVHALVLSADNISGDEDGNTENSTTDIEPLAVFVSGDGSDENDGLSAKKPFATFEKAYSALQSTGGIVVVCGKMTVDPNAPSLPTHEKDIEITSYYEGVDYTARLGAEICFYDTLNIKGPGATHFYGVKLHSEVSANIFCNGSSVKFGSRVDNYFDTGTYPSVYGGCLLTGASTDNDGAFNDYTIEIGSGYWHHVTAGNLRADRYAPMCHIKNATLKINGGTFIATDNDIYTCSAISGAEISSDIKLEITGGMFYGSVYIIGNEGPLFPYVECKYDANISVRITNAAFMGKYIKALYNKNASLFGKYDFNVESGSFSSLIYVGCEGVYSDITLSSCDAVQNKLYGFEKVVYVSSEGDDNNSGENTYSTKKTLSGAISSLQSGGTVVICSEMTLPDGFIMTRTDREIIITSKYYDTDFAVQNGAKLILEGDILLQSSVEFNNITINSNASSTFLCEGENTQFGKNVSVYGDVGITMKKNTAMHTLSIHSGSFSSVDFESSDVLSVFCMTGGSIELFRGCLELHSGDIFIDLSGGSINGDINITPNGTEGNVQLIVGKTALDGTISAAKVDGMICEALVVSDFDKSKLSGFDLIEDKYAFVKDGGQGDGSTPSLAAPNMDAALSFAGTQNACIVVCGPLTHNLEYKDTECGTLTYSSIYRNMDFGKINLAKIILDSDFHFYNDATIENISIYTKKEDTAFRCNSHIVVFGYGIQCDTLFESNEYYPSIYACEGIPTEPFNSKGESLSDKIIIKGGVWNNVYASAATDINGGVIKGALFGTKELSNNCSITVSNGIIYGGIYASEKALPNASSNITLTFNGGEIHGTIAPSYESSTDYKGRFKINISGGDFSGVEKILDASFIGGDKSNAYVNTSIDMAHFADNYIAYQNPISASDGTVCFYNGYWYLFKLSQNTVDVFRHISLSSIYSTKPYAQITAEGKVHSISVSTADGKITVFVQTIKNSAESIGVYVSKAGDGDNVSFEYVSNINGIPALSPSLFTLGGEKYMFFSLESESGADIYCAKMKSDTEFDAEPVKVLTAAEKWECGYLTTPRVLSAPDGKYYLCYTGGDVYRGSSMLGIAQIVGNDLLNQASYIKQADPVFYENENYINLVLSSFIYIDNAIEPYLIFTAKTNGENALIMQSFSFDSENAPYFGTPCDLDTLYSVYYEPKNLSELLGTFKINVADEVPTDSKIKEPFSLSSLSKEHYIIILSAFFVMIMTVIIIIIKKCRSNPAAKYKKALKKRSKHEKKKAARLKAGKLYASILEKVNVDTPQIAPPTETEAVDMEKMNLVTIAELPDNSDAESSKKSNTESLTMQNLSPAKDSEDSEHLRSAESLPEEDVDILHDENTESIEEDLSKIEDVTRENSTANEQTTDEPNELSIVGANVNTTTENTPSAQKKKRLRPTRRI